MIYKILKNFEVSRLEELADETNVNTKEPWEKPLA